MFQKQIFYNALLILATSLALTPPAFANNTDKRELDEILDLSLEELTVFAVSKHKENISEAPGVINVITQKDIRRYGARNLRDVLDRQTNMHVIGSNLYPNNRVSMRGVTQTHIDNNVLFLLNGRPIRDALTGGVNLDLYESFPLEAIEHIEIIRGPGSVLYGTNAFAGVINVITRTLKDHKEAELSVGYGSFGTRTLSGWGGFEDGDISISGAINIKNSDGDRFNNIRDELNNTGIYKTGHQSHQGVFKMDVNDFTFNGLFSDSTLDSQRSTFTFPASELRRSRQFIDAGYTKNITNDCELSSNASFHQMRAFIATI